MAVLTIGDCVCLEVMGLIFQGTHLQVFWGMPALLVFWAMNLLGGCYSLLFRISSRPFDVFCEKLRILGLAVLALVLAGYIYYFHKGARLYVYVSAGCMLFLLLSLIRRLAEDTLGRLSWTMLPVRLCLPEPYGPLWHDYLQMDSGLGLRPVPEISGQEHRIFPLRVQLGEAGQTGRRRGFGFVVTEAQPFCLQYPERALSRRIIGRSEGKLRPVRDGIGRCLNVAGAAFALLLLTPLLLLIAVSLKLSDRGAVFYGSTRIGLAGRLFTVWKFRTMKTEQELEGTFCPEEEEDWQQTRKLKDDCRILSPWRKWLRRTSLDELPQFWNVLKGEMALVGPRPVVPQEKERYGSFFDRLVSVPPGMTGLWQVSGRNHIPYERRIWWDMYYIANRSLLLDWNICLRTVKEVFTAHGM